MTPIRSTRHPPGQHDTHQVNTTLTRSTWHPPGQHDITSKQHILGQHDTHQVNTTPTRSTRHPPGQHDTHQVNMTLTSSKQHTIGQNDTHQVNMTPTRSMLFSSFSISLCSSFSVFSLPCCLANDDAQAEWIPHIQFSRSTCDVACKTHLL